MSQLKKDEEQKKSWIDPITNELNLEEENLVFYVPICNKYLKMHKTF